MSRYHAALKSSLMIAILGLIASVIPFAYLSYSAVQVQASNAVNGVIGSSVSNHLYAGLFVGLFAAFTLTFGLYMALYSKPSKKLMIIIGGILSAITLPFFIYYGFMSGNSTVISGVAYYVHPYSVQAGMPFLLSIFFTIFAPLSAIAFKHSIGRIERAFNSGSRIRLT